VSECILTTAPNIFFSQLTDSTSANWAEAAYQFIKGEHYCQHTPSPGRDLVNASLIHENRQPNARSTATT